MAENFLPNSNKKSNMIYSQLFKVSRKLKKFDVDSVSVLEQILNRLENKNTDLPAGKMLEASQAFDALFLEIEKLKALAFLFSNLTLNEDSDYNSEVQSGIVALLENIAKNIEKFTIVFGNNERLAEVKI
jgi:hypothetical protein